MKAASARRIPKRPNENAEAVDLPASKLARSLSSDENTKKDSTHGILLEGMDCDDGDFELITTSAENSNLTNPEESNEDEDEDDWTEYLIAYPPIRPSTKAIFPTILLQREDEATI